MRRPADDAARPGGADGPTDPVDGEHDPAEPDGEADDEFEPL
jgi:hypothetical protein